ncbi:hypothetical protein BDD14_6130 [Edaphobacter modestus]|uniref:Uncharacterized protein n=1 Tax=Edaphobacter modestus TaxID=388466 RepID=A0A4Q7Y335_9BACT|nr:hypothetical protein BDD14_6130 [Edaphobacter modestus]
MRRLLQLATVVLLLACLIAPLSEFFDQWDPEGLTNDTEFGVVALIFVLCLVTLVSKLIAMGSFRFDLCSANLVRTQNCRRQSKFEHCFIFLVPSLFKSSLTNLIMERSAYGHARCSESAQTRNPARIERRWSMST